MAAPWGTTGLPSLSAIGPANGEIGYGAVGQWGLFTEANGVAVSYDDGITFGFQLVGDVRGEGADGKKQGVELLQNLLPENLVVVSGGHGEVWLENVVEWFI